MTLENQALHLQITELEAQLAEARAQVERVTEERVWLTEERDHARTGLERVMKQRDSLLKSFKSIGAFVADQEAASWEAMDTTEAPHA